MSIAYRRKAAANWFNNDFVTTLGATGITPGVLAGSLLVFGMTLDSRTVSVSSITDDSGNTWRLAVRQVGAGTNDIGVEIWYTYNIPAAASLTVSVLLSGTTTTNAGLAEFTGVHTISDPLGPVDSAAAASVTGGTTFSCGSVLPARDGALVISARRCDTNAVTITEALTSISGGGTTDYSTRYGIQTTATVETGDMSFVDTEKICGALAVFYGPYDTWVDIPDFVEQEIPSSAFPSASARVGCKLWTGEAGVTVQARLYDQTNAASVGESAEVTSQTPTDATFAVTLTSGTARYRLQVTSATTDSDLFCQSSGVLP